MGDVPHYASHYILLLLGVYIDKRKTREVRWTEGRLSLAHPKGSVTPVFGATLGDQDEAGNQLAHCAILSGAGEQTKVQLPCLLLTNQIK